MNCIKTFMTLVLLIGSQPWAWAHGEDKPGPNGGFIRMPGAFHAEVIANGKNKLKVYLLDMEYKNPSVLRSSIDVTFYSSHPIKAKCEIKDSYYECIFPKSVNISKPGELKILAQRESQKGTEATYPLPLKLEKTDGGHDTH